MSSFDRPGQPVAGNAAASGAETAAEQRLANLSPSAARALRSAGQLLLKRNVDAAATALVEVLAEAPDHPEALRLHGITLQLRGRPVEAIAALQRAIASRPNDALLINTLGGALSDAHRRDAALDAFRRACELDPSLASAWLNLGMSLLARADIVEAEAALARAVALLPRHGMARVAHADALKSLGRIEDAAAEYRAALDVNPAMTQAWAGLADLKTVQFSEAEFERLRQVQQRDDLMDEDRCVAGFALAKALEDHARHEEAFQVLASANAVRHGQFEWDAAEFSRRIDSIMNAFAASPTHVADAEIGHEVIFIVSMPRSGSTLAEQVIAAHPEVEGADELPDLMIVIQEESARRGEAFPEWVGKADAADWRRLGLRYLERTERWRRAKPRHVDKALSNWTLVGAALAMLPGARIVNCRRDPVETCWSCFKQLFARGQQVFSYSLDDLAAYWTDYDRLMFFWHARHPGRVYDLAYENLVASPEEQIRALLEFCALPFNAACLRAHQSGRIVRTASAAQVRQPIAAETAKTAGYGALLDPLRRALGVSAAR